MKKAIAILLVIVAAFLGTLLYFRAHDTRTADSLSAYARIEFTGLRGSDGSATSAHFTVSGAASFPSRPGAPAAR